MKRIWRGAALPAAATLLFAAICAVALPLLSHDAGTRVYAVPLAGLYALSAALVLRGSGEKGEQTEPLWACGLLTLLALALLARVSLLPAVSDDYASYLSEWLESIRMMPGFTALAADIGNYNMPYFYLLFGIGKLLPRSAELYAIKLISLLFDLLLAYWIMQLVRLKRKGRSVAAGAFLAALLAPSVLLNGAMWGQCDSMFTAFALAALLCGLGGRSRACWALFAVSLSLKLQCVFLLPMLPVLLMSGRIRLRDCWVFPAVFLLLLVPAMLAGKSFLSCVTIYYRQARSYSELSMLAPSLYAWFPAGARSNIPVTAAGIFAAGAVVCLLLCYLFRRRARLDTRSHIDAALLFALCIPFFLPLMHERYFFAADAMSVVYLFWRPRRWYVCGIVCLGSFLCYIAYLFDAATVPLWLLAFGMLAAICLVLRDTLASLEPSDPVA